MRVADNDETAVEETLPTLLLRFEEAEGCKTIAGNN
jgi:hypothetical protein